MDGYRNQPTIETSVYKLSRIRRYKAVFTRFLSAWPWWVVVSTRGERTLIKGAVECEQHPRRENVGRGRLALDYCDEMGHLVAVCLGFEVSLGTQPLKGNEFDHLNVCAPGLDLKLRHAATRKGDF